MIKKVLIIAPVHEEIKFLKQKSKLDFVYYQAQQGWVDALKSLKKEVKVIRFTDTFLIPNKPRIFTSTFISYRFPIFASRVKRYINKYNLFFFEEIIRSKYFLITLNKFRPDLLIISGGFNGISINILEEAKKKYKFKAILLSGVNPKYGSSKYERDLIKKSFFDFIFTNDKGYNDNWHNYGKVVAEVIPVSSANTNFQKKYKLTRKEIRLYSSDICFIGTLSDYRQSFLENLLIFDIKIWGKIPPGVKLHESLINSYKGEAYGIEMSKVYSSSKIAINVHEEDMIFGGNMKTFEIPACGCFQLIDHFDKSWYKNGNEIVKYNDIDDLKHKIKYYLKNPKKRNMIAKKGYIRTINEHTYEKHFKKIFKILDDKN